MHTVLKGGTAHLHARLDALPNIKALMNPRYSSVSYCLALKAYARAHQHIEQKLINVERFLSLDNLPKYIPRLPSLFHDLSCLAPNDDPQQYKIYSVTVPIEAFQMSHYIGLRYVIEGASQGSKIIARHLEKNLPHLTAQAFSFWKVQLEAAEQWPIFCEYISHPAKSTEYGTADAGSCTESISVFYRMLRLL
ncbi:MAG: biliverdin-producing heme oxygenase [Nitrosospira sp.]